MLGPSKDLKTRLVAACCALILSFAGSSECQARKPCSILADTDNNRSATKRIPNAAIARKANESALVTTLFLSSSPDPPPYSLPRPLSQNPRLYHPHLLTSDPVCSMSQEDLLLQSRTSTMHLSTQPSPVTTLSR